MVTEDYNGIFIDFESDIVTGIWITGSPDTSIQELAKVLNEVGTKWSLLLMDWNSLDLIDLSKMDEVTKYLDYSNTAS